MTANSRLTARYSSKGFTLVELLVVIAIIGVLVSLLLPAVQAARRAARRTQCQNNIRQVALAVLNYESAREALPQFMSWWKDPNSTSQYAEQWDLGPNWIIHTLPYMEQQSTYDAFDFTAPITNPVNELARSAVIPGLLCPEDEENNSQLFSGTSPATTKFGNNWGRGNYGGNAGLYWGPSAEWDALGQWGNDIWPQDIYRGVFSSISETELKSIVDGTTNTIMIAEIRAGVVEFDLRGTWAMSGAAPSGVAGHGFYGDDNGPNNLELAGDDVVGCGDILKSYGRRGGAAELVRLKMGCSSFGDNWQQAARSRHEGGVFVAMCDGSAQFVSDDIELSSDTTGYGLWVQEDPSRLGTWDRLNLSADEQLLDSDAF